MTGKLVEKRNVSFKEYASGSSRCWLRRKMIITDSMGEEIFFF
jgi:hypothetical protein